MKIGISIQEIEIDNKWVVLYCPSLWPTSQVHINVEYCNSVKSIKYIRKYVSKGNDETMLSFERDETSVNEFGRYRSGRYINSNETVC
jgi:hypothetical protein